MDFTKNILQEWGLSVLVDHFVENEIDEETFLQLSDKDIDELIPILGRRKKFIFKYNQYMIERAGLIIEDKNNPKEDLKLMANQLDMSNSYLDETSSNTSSSTITLNDDSDDIKGLQPHYYPQKPTLGEPNFITQSSGHADETVRTLLDSTEEGRLIKNSYGCNKKFLRHNLCSLIIKNELKKSSNKTISTDRFKQLAQEINDIFIHEDAAIYYLPYTKEVGGKVVSARGKLWSTYTHQRHILRNGGLLKNNKVEEPKPSTSREVPNLEDNEQNTELLAWLENNSEPFPQVLENWKLTAPFRLDFNFNDTETIDQYFKKYPVLNKQCGHILLDSDFNYLFSDKENCLFIEWPQICKNVYLLLKKKKDSYLQELLTGDEKQYDTMTDDIIQILALKYLPLLFQSPLIKTKVKHWKPSKQELLSGFILFINDVSNLQNVLESRQNKYKAFKLSAQPIPVIVGTYPDLQCFVSINDVLYKLDSPLKAVDLCFKAFHALHASYPVDADPTWIFVQKGIYKITTKLDKKYASVDTVFADVQNMQTNLNV